MTTNRTPNFFIVGASKSATTAMDAYLAQHPDIFMASRKECHHFATDLLPPGDPMRSSERYSTLFTDARDEKVIGESSVFYLYSKEAARNIYEFNRHAKILVHLRNPVDVLISHHAQVLYNGDEDITDLKKAMLAEKDRQRGKNIPQRMRFADRLYYSELFRFSDQLDRYFMVFGRENVHIVLYDDLKADTPGVYRDVLRFLEVDPQFQAEFRIINANKRIRSATVRALLRDPPAWLSIAGRNILPPRARSMLREAAGRLNTRYEPRRPIDPALRRRLEAHYAPEIDRLAGLLDRDLGGWLEPVPDGVGRGTAGFA